MNMDNRSPVKLFDTSSLPKGQTLHPKVELLMGLPGERRILEEWSDGFIDRDGKFVTDFQTRFHSAFLELFLFATLKTQRMTVDLSRPAPDFLITAPEPFIIEAVSAGVRKDGRLEADRNLDDVLSMLTPPWLNPGFEDAMVEGIVRSSNSIWEKATKYQETYAYLPWITPAMPYAIALGSFAQVNYGSEYLYSIVALLYGYVFDAQTTSWSRRQSVLKPVSGAPIDLNLFARVDFCHVSAVFFTCTLTLGKLTALTITRGLPTFNMVYEIVEDDVEPRFNPLGISPNCPADLFDGLFVLHNPNADNPLPKSAFAGTHAIHVRDVAHGFTTEGEAAPLVARISISRALITQEWMRLWMVGAAMQFNQPWVDSLTDNNGVPEA
jgi:hypothetical protein